MFSSYMKNGTYACYLFINFKIMHYFVKYFDISPFFLLVSFVLYEKGDTLLYNIFKFLFSFFKSTNKNNSNVLTSTQKNNNRIATTQNTWAW